MANFQVSGTDSVRFVVASLDLASVKSVPEQLRMLLFEELARDKFFYSDDNGLLVGIRLGDYKYVFSEQRKQGTLGVWAEAFTTLRLQKIFNEFAASSTRCSNCSSKSAACNSWTRADARNLASVFPREW